MNGTYGTIKPAVINIEQDVQILYNYKPDRGHDTTKTFEELSASNLLNTYESTNGTIPISGLYNLKLPLSIFNKKGIYTIYIKPKEMQKTIYAIGQLRDFPDVRGVIFKASDFNDTQLSSSNGLVGYRIDYGTDGNGYSRIITSSNRCSLVPSNGIAKFILNSESNGVGGGDLIFCTVTPSTANSFSPNAMPSIGSNSESVKVVNTKFSPLMFEIEMVDHDAETISYMLEGDQVRNLENGTFTVFNHDKEIYRQYETYTVKTQLGRPMFDVKTNKDVIDSTQSYDNTISLT